MDLQCPKAIPSSLGEQHALEHQAVTPAELICTSASGADLFLWRVWVALDAGRCLELGQC